MGRLLGWLAVMALLGAGGFALWRKLGKPVEVRAVPVVLGPAIATVFATGWIEPRERRMLRPPRPAIVARLYAKEGDEVRAGSPLVELRDTARAVRKARVQAELDRLDEDLAEGSALRRRAQAQIADATVQSKWAQSEVERATSLLAQGLVTQRALDELVATRDSIAERVRLATDELAQTLAELKTRRAQSAFELDVLIAAEQDDRLLAPFDGVVLARFAEEGESVNPERDLMKFGDLRALWVEGEVDEEDAGRVELGQRVLVRVAGDEDELVAGNVVELFPDSTRVTRSYRVRVGFPSAKFTASGPLGLRGTLRAAGGRALLTGSSCELGIVVGESASALVFPRSALTARGTVFVVEGDRVRERMVKLGLTNFDRCEATSGLAAGESVVFDRVSTLSDGAHVVAREATLAPQRDVPPVAPAALTVPQQQ